MAQYCERAGGAEKAFPQEENGEFNESESDLLDCLVGIFVFLCQNLQIVRYRSVIYNNGVTSYWTFDYTGQKYTVER